MKVKIMHFLYDTFFPKSAITGYDHIYFWLIVQAKTANIKLIVKLSSGQLMFVLMEGYLCITH